MATRAGRVGLEASSDTNPTFPGINKLMSESDTIYLGSDS